MARRRPYRAAQAANDVYGGADPSFDHGAARTPPVCQSTGIAARLARAAKRSSFDVKLSCVIANPNQRKERKARDEQRTGCK